MPAPHVIAMPQPLVAPARSTAKVSLPTTTRRGQPARLQRGADVLLLARQVDAGEHEHRHLGPRARRQPGVGASLRDETRRAPRPCRRRRRGGASCGRRAPSARTSPSIVATTMSVLELPPSAARTNRVTRFARSADEEGLRQLARHRVLADQRVREQRPAARDRRVVDGARATAIRS